MKLLKNVFVKIAIVLLLAFSFMIVMPIFTMWVYNSIAYYSENKTRPFDIHEWNLIPRPGVCGMFEDMQHRVLKPGMSKQHVLALLGKPAGVSDMSYRAKNHLSYGLGSCVFWYSNFLIILFDENDLLTSVVMESYD